jgi:phage terminase small subunit
MPTGIETSPETIAEFRAHYLYSGNASESARAVGLPDRTGRDIAARLAEDTSFAADRRRLRDTALDELVAMRMRVARVALERFEAPAPAPLVGANGEIPQMDRRPDFGKLVMDAEKNAQALAKIENPEPDKPTEVTIRVFGPGGEEPKDESGDGSPSSG